LAEQYHFDAIVIGSGITGGWAAKELCERGLQTVLLERGTMVEHIKDYTHANKHPWELPHRNELTKEEEAIYYVQKRHYSIGEDNKQYYTRDIDQPYKEEQPFDWIRPDVLGGRSLLWGRISLRWSDLAFSANAKEGVGIDWPIRYKDLAPWYDHVERFIGISGTRESIDTLPDGIFQAPFDMNCAETAVKHLMERKHPSIRIIPARVANITAPLDGRSACQARNLCHRGCPFGAYFSSQSSTLPAAVKTGKLTIRTGSIVNTILYDEKKGKATGVEIIDRDTLKTYVYTADVIFLNASTIGTAQVLLNSTSPRFRNGMGNDYDIVGRYLMDHHKGLTISADVEGQDDHYYYGRRPTGIFIPRFPNVYKQETDFLRGYDFQGNGYRSRNAPSDEVGAELKAAATEPGKWRIQFYHYGETLPYAENRVTLNPSIKDVFGRPGLSINCSFKENEQKMFNDVGTALPQMMEDAGLKNIRVQGKMSTPGNANHEMGTARMGHDEKTSVLNKWNQLHAVKNVFVTDGSCMTSSHCINPSLTYMALTARAVDYAVSEMKKGTI